MNIGLFNKNLKSTLIAITTLIGFSLLLGACSKNQNPDKALAQNILRPLNAIQTSEGGWESSGGDGVACFKNIDAAKIARSELKMTGFLSPLTREKIQSVVTLETWDFFRQQPVERSKITYLSDFLKSRDFNLEPKLNQLRKQQQIFQSVLNNLNALIPLFKLRVEMVERLAPLNSWIASSQIPQIDDSTPSRSLDDAPSCVLIQLADRRTQSTDGKLPKTEIIYDQEIFEKYLSEVDKALLIMHEYLYLIGKEGNHKNSDTIRKINVFFFSTDMFNFAENLKYLSNRALAMRQIVSYPFGDYIRFFKKEDILQKENLSIQDSRYNSTITLMDKARKSQSECLKKENYDKKSKADQNKLISFCQRESIENNPDLWSSLTDEEAFIYLARFHFDQTSEINGAALGVPFQGTGLEVNSEALSIPGDDTKETTDQSKFYCHLLEEKPATEFLALQEKAKVYCQNKVGAKSILLKDKPLEKITSCDSYERLFIGTFKGDISGMILTKLDKNTGAIHNDNFTGKFILISSKDGEEGRNLGMGNREYASQNIYRIVPSSKENLEELVWLLKEKPSKDLRVPEPDLFISLTIVKDSQDIVIQDPALAEQTLSQVSFENVKGFDVRLNCTNRETNLPDEAWYLH